MAAARTQLINLPTSTTDAAAARPTYPDTKEQPLCRENESADTFAQHGYDVEQNPPPKPNGKEPDYKIEGEYFDNYAPRPATSTISAESSVRRFPRARLTGSS